MSLAASAENTMNILKVQVNQVNDNNSVDHVDSDKKNNKDLKEEDKIFFKSTLNDSDDDDMVVIILEENVENVENNEVDAEVDAEDKNENTIETSSDGNSHVDTNIKDDNVDGDTNVDVTTTTTKKEKIITHPPKQKYIGIEVYTHLQQTLESQKMYPLLPCNMISSFARVMEFVEYFDIPSEERKRLVVDLVKILAYSNNDYGSRDCFEYFVEHNMIDDIIKTIVDSTKNRYDINRFPHTNRKIVLSCVSITNKIKIVKPIKIESIFEEFKLNLCGLKRFFKMKEKEESKQT